MPAEGQKANGAPGRAALRQRADRLGDELCRDALAWAKTIAVSVSPEESTEEELFEEVLAYAISLTGLRLGGLDLGQSEEFLRLVRERTAIVKAGTKWRRARRRRRLGAPVGGWSTQDWGTTSLVSLDGVSDRRVTKEMFEHFRVTTGLSSDVLVGKGENLASLVFYIAVHAVLSAAGPLARANVLAMLRACRDCRAHFEEVLVSSLGTQPEAVAQPGSGKQYAERGALPASVLTTLERESK
jgi:hypothetical protein